MVRSIVVVLVALSAAIQILRQGAVDSFSERRPDLAVRVWPGHPDVQLSAAMTRIAELTRQGQPVTQDALNQVYEAARAAPLAPEPFLVRGVQAQLAGETATAERAFTAAKRRDPRSLPARYFLADYYLRQGDAAVSLREIAVLARLAPAGIKSLAPHVATYARQRATWPQLRALFRAEPLLEQATLQVLAGDASNVQAVLALSTRKDPDSLWLRPMLDSLVKAGRYAEGRQVWASVAGTEPRGLIYDPGFADAKAPPPFNWSLTSSAVGLAERQRGGGLHVIYHGREDGALAAQTIMLEPGRYRFSISAPGSSARAEGLSWVLWCMSSNSELGRRPLKDVAAQGWSFDIPSGCPAQRLELSGSSSDMPQAVDVSIRSVSLTREGGGA